MSRETDAIIAVHEASGAPGIVTDINTLGVHSAYSNHYKKDVHPSTPAHYLDQFNGKVGRAVDFGGSNGPLSEEESLEVFAVFAQFGRDGKLAELFCGQAEYCVYGGIWMRWTSMPKKSREAIRPAHMNHVHVAVKPGVLLEPPQQSQPSENDMSDALTITYDSGHKTVVTPDGAVQNAGTPFFGSIYDVPAAEKKDWVTCFAATAIDPNDESKGYCIWNARPNSKYEFTPEWWANHSKK